MSVNLVSLDGWRDITNRQIASEARRDLWRNVAVAIALIGATVSLSLGVTTAHTQGMQIMATSMGVGLGFIGLYIFTHFRGTFERIGVRGELPKESYESYKEVLATGGMLEFQELVDSVGLAVFIQNELLTHEEATKLLEFLDEAVRLPDYAKGKNATWYLDEWEEVQATLHINQPVSVP